MFSGDLSEPAAEALELSGVEYLSGRGEGHLLSECFVGFVQAA